MPVNFMFISLGLLLIWVGLSTMAGGQIILMIREIAINSRSKENDAEDYTAAKLTANVILIVGACSFIFGLFTFLVLLVRATS